jgi:hypothetical protein
MQSWFRELPGGLLNSLPPDQVMRCRSEEDATQLVALLPMAKAALYLDWRPCCQWQKQHCIWIGGPVVICFFFSFENCFKMTEGIIGWFGSHIYIYIYDSMVEINSR